MLSKSSAQRPHMPWFSILPAHLTVVETCLIRFFVSLVAPTPQRSLTVPCQLLLGMLTIGPWALLIIYDLLLWIFRSIFYLIPFVGGRARGKKRPRAPSLSERPSGRPRTFSLGGTQFTGAENTEKEGLKERMLDASRGNDLSDIDGPD